MTDANRQVLDRLFRQRAIRLVRGPIFDQVPPPLPPDFDFAKVEGLMLGVAIGDALGNTTEGQLPSQRRSRYGEIRDYLPNRYAHGKAVGLPSDDTQLAFWTLEQMLEDGRFVPAHVAHRFSRGWILGIGSTVKQFLRNYEKGIPWEQCGVASAGNGALMRIMPVLVPHLRAPSAALWTDAALCAMLTHNDAGSTAACVAFVSMLWQLLAMRAPPLPEWWMETYVTTARELEGDTRYRPRSHQVASYEGPIWRFVQERVQQAYRRRESVLEAGIRWYSGAYLLETMPSVIYILMRHGHDPEEAIVRAVNDTKDNDTIGAIVGAAVGALHGRDGLPARWIDNLLGRTTDRDDDRIFELLKSARETWWPSPESQGSQTPLRGHVTEDPL
ncbi:MAG TPA: ADP-ribosylglycohydrolase [Planctomycetaceae bacterium]|nr:ADP-ribosylglycohydrolase [Planctomycetaceae bacterium]